MKIGWISRSGKFYPCKHTEHHTVEMPSDEWPAIQCCINGFAFFEFPARELTQAQLDALFDWTQEEGAESWEVIADFLGIEQR